LKLHIVNERFRYRFQNATMFFALITSAKNMNPGNPWFIKSFRGKRDNENWKSLS